PAMSTGPLAPAPELHRATARARRGRRPDTGPFQGNAPTVDAQPMATAPHRAPIINAAAEVGASALGPCGSDSCLGCSCGRRARGGPPDRWLCPMQDGEAVPAA